MRSRRSRRQAVAISTAILFTLTTVTGATAEPKLVRLALVDVDGNTSTDSTDIHYFLEKGIRTSKKKVQLMALDSVLNAGAQANDIQNIVFGTESLALGMKAFNSGNCEEAIDQLSQAVTYFEQSFAFLDTPASYLAALVHQGVCLARTGSTASAKQVLYKAFVVRPRLDFSAYAKEKALFEEARSKVRDRELSSVTVTTLPVGSRVFVDGGYRGVSPAYRPGLRRGIHFVRVERQGYARVGLKSNTKLQKAGDSDVKLEIKQEAAARKSVLDGLLGGLRTELGQPEAGPSIERLKSLLLVDYIVLFRTSGASDAKIVEVSLYNLATGSLLKKVKGTVNWAQRDKAAKNAVIALAHELLDTELQKLVTVVTPGNGGGKTSSGGVHTKWWFWTIIGAVVLGTTVGLAVGLQPEEEKPGLPEEDGKGALILRF